MSVKDPSETMTTLLGRLAQARKQGYVLDFTVTRKGLSVTDEDQFYQPDQIRVDDFYRFEGASDPSENAILYLVSTDDGKKGTLSDAYGSYADATVSAFMDQVEIPGKKH